MLTWLESNAWAQAAEAPAAGNPFVAFVPFILIFVLFYFLLVMPQQKRAKKRKSMIDGLKKGDRVTTSGGMIGTVTNLATDQVTLQIAEGVRVKVMRGYIEEVKADETEMPEAK